MTAARTVQRLARLCAASAPLLLGAPALAQGLPIPPLVHVDVGPLTDPQLLRGQATYRQHCTHCHGAGRGMPGTQSLAIRDGDARPAVLEERTDLTAAAVALFVRNGSGAMAPYRKTEIGDAELADLAAYLARPRP